MKKIIAVIDGLKYAAATTDYAVNLAKAADTFLVGVFLDDVTYHSYKAHELLGNRGLDEEKIAAFDEQDHSMRRLAAGHFEEACQLAGLQYAVHHDRNIALIELLHESIYADLLIIGCSETFTHYSENTPTRFIKEMLGEVQCPVLVVHDKYEPVEKVVFLYDGEPSSVFAIRMFSYVLPGLDKVTAEVVCVKPPQQSAHVPDNHLLKEFMKRHFPQVGYLTLKGDPKAEIAHYLSLQKKNILIVLGAYKRGTVSRWLRPSMADSLMHEYTVPLFIAHN